MSLNIPIDGWYTTSIVVRDYRQVISHYARFFGISHWEIFRYDGNHLSNATFEGKAIEHRYIRVVGRNNDLGIELIQPIDGSSSYQHMLDTVGEGVHHVNLTQSSVAGIKALNPILDELGVSIRQSGTIYEAADVYLLDTRSMVSNVMFEITCPKIDNWKACIVPDEVLDIDLGLLGPKLLPTASMLHLGVVCKDRDATKAGLTHLLGMTDWIEFKIESDVTMSDTTYFGKKVYHKYNNHVGRVGNFALELITPETDKCVYDDFLKEQGEGVHHFFPSMCSKEEFDALLPALEALDMPIIQGGTIDGLIEYYYIDTRQYLSGVTTEVVIPLCDDWKEKMFASSKDAWVLTGE
ncbi:MAG: VOC family protein [Cycloclasticus sp.]|nr:VOC family protein [Cycloclasticus sp.]